MSRSSSSLVSRSRPSVRPPGETKPAGNPRRISTSETSPLFLRTLKTPLGWIAYQGTERGITLLTFGHRSRKDALERMDFASIWNGPEQAPMKNSAESLPKWVSEAEAKLLAYASGEPVDLAGIPCDLPEGTRFERRVREALGRVRYGQTISYGELAEAAGAPRAARAVGSVMARNRIPLIIACHRVLAAGGKLGGYSAPSGLTMKERLLHMEQETGPGENVP